MMPQVRQKCNGNHQKVKEGALDRLAKLSTDAAVSCVAVTKRIEHVLAFVELQQNCVI